MRAIRDLVNAALAADFDALYSRVGRPGIAPERLLRALLLQCFYSVRSDDGAAGVRPAVPRFVGLGIDEAVWDASVFSKNRDRLLAGEVAQRFLAELLALPEVRRLLSSEHFSVDGTLLQALGQPEELPRQGRQ